MKEKRNVIKKLMALFLVFALVFSTNGITAKAASKKYVKSLSVSKTSLSLKKGKKGTITATVKIYGKAKTTVSAKSSSSSVAKVKVGKVNKKGVTSISITAVKAGKATITITTNDKAKNKKALKKTIQVKVTSSTPAKEDSNKVKWTVKEEKFMGAYSSKNEETGEIENIPKELTRKYVSFSPWPTTNEQVKYVIQHCDDPYVIGALYIVALDNFKYDGLGNYSGEVYKMLDTLMSGAGTVTGSNYQLSNFAKQQICGFGTKQVVTPDGTAVNVSTFASRAYLKGATPYNDYTPEGGLKDKTKWQIPMDEYVYCGDLENGYITVCPQRYTEEQETEGGDRTVTEHWQGIRIGFRWNKTAKVWLPTDNVSLNTPPTGALKPFNIEKQVLFSSNYMAPQPDQGW